MDKQRALRYKTPIIILALVALAFTILSCIRYFVYYDWEYNNGNGFYELIVGFPDVFHLLSFFISIAPYVLLVIYLLKFHNKFKATVLVPIIFGLIAFASLYYIFESEILIRFYGSRITRIYSRRSLFDIPLIVAFVLATINALKGFSKKAFHIIAIVVGLLAEFWSIINLFQRIEWYLEEELYLCLFTRPISILGTIALYVSLLLFGLKNRIPAIISVSPKKEKKNAEQSLRLLNDKLEFGIITEEEYKAQRAEIINNL